LVIDGKRMIEVIIDRLRPFFGEIMIVTDRKDNFLNFKDVRVVEDLVKECGPLGGIYTGLKKMSKESAFFIACDMPFLHNGLIERILDATAEGGIQEAVVPLVEGEIEPLHSVYSKRVLPKIKMAIEQKRLAIKDFLKDCHCKYIEVSEDERKAFTNINTPEDLSKVKGVGNGE
ncbi:MAG: molybdenum cofactor guanylyltransferase, partial [Candidatus Omnitrophica bacterium]|nr:molybdenum cofactor guanylyltransferase [Candidatus Omnitrophota bacterium]